MNAVVEQDGQAVSMSAASSVPKTLLVTWTPPGDRNVGEIILRDLCQFFPPGRLGVCEVSRFPPGEPHGGLRIAAPDESPWRPLPGRAGGFLNHARIRTTFAREADAIAGRIAEFAAQQGAQQLWVTLNSQALVRLAARLQRITQLPLRALVWDPIGFLARHQGWDAHSAAWSEANFDRAMAVSASAMVVSQSMVDDYGHRFGLPCKIVRHAFDVSRMLTPGDDDGFIKIGFAGTLYDASQLDSLVQALSAMNWMLGHRRVKLRIIGNYYRFNRLNAPAHIELMGWRSTEDARALLAECAFAYLPIPFGAHFADFARLAFPTKLSTYLAAGCPILLHAPAYADVAKFCAQQGVGAVCASMDPSVLGGTIKALHARLDDASLRDAVWRTCVENFSREVMRRNFADFIGAAEYELLP